MTKVMEPDRSLGTPFFPEESGIFVFSIHNANERFEVSLNTEWLKRDWASSLDKRNSNMLLSI